MSMNYQKELDSIIDSLRGQKKKLLLHACCAPCSSYCLFYLTQYFDVTVFFYNPNIDGEEEFKKRKSELYRLIDEAQFPVDVVCPPYDNEEFLRVATGLEKEPERGRRCDACFTLRLGRAAKYAYDNGFDYFTTTLTISPLKNADTLNRIGNETSKLYNVPFLPSDFKKLGGYQRSIELSKQYNLYRQNYCGCTFSKTSKNKPE